MRIGIDAKWVFGGTPGIRTHITGLIKALQKIDKKNEYVVYFNKSTHISKSCFRGEQFAVKTLFPSNTLLRVILSFPIATKRDQVDVLWTQMFTPFHLNAKKVVTIHDIIFETHPELFLKRELFYFKFMKYTASMADAIFTVSEYSKKTLVDRWNIRPDKITVTYNAVGDQFEPIDNHTALLDVKRKYDLPEKFVLYVGRINERKNLRRLIQSSLRITGTDFKLIIAGEEEGKRSNILSAKDAMKGKVNFLNYVPDKDLPALYNLATVFAYVPIVEGFGIPVLEAMACGCPVIASNTSSMPEVTGNAGILVNPLDQKEIAAALGFLLSNVEERKKRSLKGMQRARWFSWEASAERILEVFEAMV